MSPEERRKAAAEAARAYRARKKAENPEAWKAAKSARNKADAANRTEEARERRRASARKHRTTEGHRQAKNAWARRFYAAMKAAPDDVRESYLAARRDQRRRREAAMSPMEKREALAKHRTRVRRYRVGQHGTAHGTALAGSVLAAAAPSPWRDLLAELTALAPGGDYREDVIAEAAMLAIEGLSPAEAIKAAGRNVRREVGISPAAVPLHECYWL